MSRVEVSIVHRHIPVSESLSSYIREQVSLLEEAGHSMTRCHVVLEPLRHPAQGLAKRCRVHVDVHVPGKTVSSDRVPTEGEGHDDPYLGVRQAFDAIRRQLSEHHSRFIDRRRKP